MAKKNKKSDALKGQKPPAPEFKVVAQPDVFKGVYSNVAVIQHTENEFIFDFLLKLGGDSQLVSRVILSPSHILALLDALKINIEKYESKFGKIKKEKKPKISVNWV